MNPKFWFLILIGAASIPAVMAQTTDSWSDNGNNLGSSFKWETASQWSLGVAPSTAQTYVMVTNAIFGMGPFGRTVNIDPVTVLSNAINGCLTINSLTISTPSSHPVELFLNNTGTTIFRIFSPDAHTGGNSLTVSTHGILSITNSSVTVDEGYACILDDNGAVIVNTGTINADMFIGGGGQMTVFDGNVSGAYLFNGDGGNTNSPATLTISGGIFSVLSLQNGLNPAPATIWLTGGTLSVPEDVEIGMFGPGQLVISNGSYLVGNTVLGAVAGAAGTLTMAGGTGSTSNMMVGLAACTSTGVVIISGGSLFITNAAHSGTLDLENGTVTLSGGTLVLDAFVKTNPCGTFQQTGGTLVVGSVTSIVSSVFAIGAVGVEGSNLRVTWQTPGGMTNVVQVTSGGPDGSYNTNFTDLSPSFIIPAGNPVTTNYLDVGGATNFPARYYRVRLVP
jgi:hypothetical protein